MLFLALLFIPLSQDLNAQNDGDAVSIGNYRIIESKILGEQRRILVHLPEGYESSTLRYPVVYHLYGDYVMSYFAEAASVLERLYNNKAIPQVILIGVDNTDRYRDLRPLKPDGSPGGAEKFAHYFREELIPFINSQYRTGDYKVLAGVQAGTCFGLYSLMEQPDLFQAYILDNSFDNPKIVDDYLITRAKSFFTQDKTIKKFLFMKVDKGSTNLPHALEEKSIIESNTPKEFRFEFLQTEAVKNFMFETNFSIGCTKLFEGYEIPYDYSITGIEDIQNYYDDYSRKIGFTANIPDRVLVEAVDYFNRQQQTSKARQILEFMLKINPNSLDGLFQLGQIKLLEGKYDEAKAHFTKFLTLRPQEAMVQNRISQIDKMINESALYEVEQVILAEGLKKGKERFKSLLKNNPEKKYFEEAEFNTLGYRFLNEGKTDEAVEVFAMCTESFPMSANAWDSLGEAYLKRNDKKSAKESLEKSLDLNPKNTNAKMLLEQMRK